MMGKRWMVLVLVFILISLGTGLKFLSIGLNNKGESLGEKKRFLYVGDSVKIQKFDENGNFLGVFGRDEIKPMGYIWDMEIDNKGNLYVIGDYPMEIKKFDKNGRLLMSFGKDALPCGIAVDGEGNIYITTDDHKVKKFTSERKFILSFGREGEGPGEFKDPFGIAIDGDGNIYVADRNNHRIQKFTPTGKFILSFGKEGEGPGEFRYPVGIAIGNDGNIYVADTENCRIQKFTKDGEFILSFGERLEVDPGEAIMMYYREVLKKDPEETLNEEEAKRFMKEFEEYHKRHLMKSVGKFHGPGAIAVNF